MGGPDSGTSFTGAYWFTGHKIGKAGCPGAFGKYFSSGFPESGTLHRLLVYICFNKRFRMNITDLLQSQLSGGVLETLSKQIGGADTQKTQVATSGIMNILLGAMAKNASTPSGASALSNALDRDHDGSVLDDLMGMFTGQAKPANPKATNGDGILGHILGNRKDSATETISKMSGLDKNQVGSLMVSLAPMIMGALGKAKKDNNLDASGLAGMLGGVIGGLKTGGQAQQDPKMAMLTAFLDKDGDGSIVDDVAGMGMSFLGRLFGRKK